MKPSEIEQLLPSVWQRTADQGAPVAALLSAMESLHAPCESVLEDVEVTFGAYRTPDRFVPMLARWVDLDRFFPQPGQAGDIATSAEDPISTGVGRLRELIAAAAHLSQWRGTAIGLRRFLEFATGAEGFELEENPVAADGRPRPFHLLVRAPGALEIHRSLIERIVEQEKPAYVTYELEFGRSGPGGDQ